VRSSATTLVSVSVLAVVIAVAVAVGGGVVYRATLPDAQTHLYPASRAVAVWATRWPHDDASALARSALAAPEATAPPVLAGTTLLVLGPDRRLYALDPLTGAQQWELGYTDGRRIVDFRVTASRLVLLVRRPDAATGLADSSLVAVDADTRAPLWERPLDADVFPGSITTGADSVFLAAADNVDGSEYQALRQRNVAVSLHPRLRAYALPDGAQRWERALPERAEAAPVERVALTLADREVVASVGRAVTWLGMAIFDAATGQGLWQAADGSEALGVSRGRLVARSGGDLALLAPGTGRVVGRLPGQAARAGPAVVAGDVLYQVASDHVTAVDLVFGRGLWTTALDTPRRVFGAPEGHVRPPAVQDGRVYLGGRDENVYSIDARTGAVQWKFPAQLQGVLAASSAPLRYGGLVLVQDDQLTAYRAPG
jgi:outer membrane protein assembly factor BamB